MLCEICFEIRMHNGIVLKTQCGPGSWGKNKNPFTGPVQPTSCLFILYGLNFPSSHCSSPPSPVPESWHQHLDIPSLVRRHLLVFRKGHCSSAGRHSPGLTRPRPFPTVLSSRAPPRTRLHPRGTSALSPLPSFQSHQRNRGMRKEWTVLSQWGGGTITFHPPCVSLEMPQSWDQLWGLELPPPTEQGGSFLQGKVQGGSSTGRILCPPVRREVIWGSSY